MVLQQRSAAASAAAAAAAAAQAKQDADQPSEMELMVRAYVYGSHGSVVARVGGFSNIGLKKVESNWMRDDCCDR